MKETKCGNSWLWACTKLREGERVRWKHWSEESFIRVDKSGVVNRYSWFDRRLMYMGIFRLDLEKMEKDGWLLYKDPPMVEQNEILFRRFR